MTRIKVRRCKTVRHVESRRYHLIQSGRYSRVSKTGKQDFFATVRSRCLFLVRLCQTCCCLPRYWLFTRECDAHELLRPIPHLVSHFSLFNMSRKRPTAFVRGRIAKAAMWQDCRTIGLRFGVSPTTVSRLSRLNETGTIELHAKNARGRPKKISDRAETHIKRTLLQHRWYSL